MKEFLLNSAVFNLARRYGMLARREAVLDYLMAGQAWQTKYSTNICSLITRADQHIPRHILKSLYPGLAKGAPKNYRNVILHECQDMHENYTEQDKDNGFCPSSRKFLVACGFVIACFHRTHFLLTVLCHSLAFRRFSICLSKV